MNRLRKYAYIMSFCGAAIGAMAVARSYLSGDNYLGNEELYGKTAIITGSNRGIGKECAKELAKRGAKVILACRDMEKCNETKSEIMKETYNKNVECIHCDLSSLKSVKEFVNAFNEKNKFLHILVNNAATMWNPKSITKEGFETHLGVNHFGHFYLTNLLLDKLKYSKPSRIVVVTCRDHLKGKINFSDLNLTKNYDEEEAYNQSKLANVLFSNHLSDALKDSGVTVNCVDPGYCNTDLLRNSSLHRSPYSPVSYIFKVFLKTAKMGAQPVVFACVNQRFENETGKYIRDFNADKSSEELVNKNDAERLWQISEKWTRLK